MATFYPRKCVTTRLQLENEVTSNISAAQVVLLSELTLLQSVLSPFYLPTAHLRVYTLSHDRLYDDILRNLIRETYTLEGSVLILIIAISPL